MTYEAHGWDEDCWAVNVAGDRANPIAYCNTEVIAQQIVDALNAPTVRVEVDDQALQALATAALEFAAARK